KLTTRNLAHRRQRNNSVKNQLVQVWNTDFERSEHARAIGFYQTIFTQVGFKIGTHQNVGFKAGSVTTRAPLPGLKVIIYFYRFVIIRAYELAQIFAEHRKIAVSHPSILDLIVTIERSPIESTHAAWSPRDPSQQRWNP